MHEGPIENKRRCGLRRIEACAQRIETDGADARRITARMGEYDRRLGLQSTTDRMIEIRKSSPRILDTALDQIPPRKPGRLGRHCGEGFEASVPLVLARNNNEAELTAAGQRTKALQPVRPVADTAHHADNDKLRGSDRLLEEQVDRHRVRQLAEIGEAKRRRTRIARRRRVGERGKLRVGGREKDDVAGRQPEIDGGIAVVDAGHVAGKEVHRPIR